MYAQAKSINGAWYTTHERGGRVDFAGAKKLLDDGKEMDTLFASAVAKAIKMNKKYKAKDTSESENETEAEHFNF